MAWLFFVKKAGILTVLYHRAVEVSAYAAAFALWGAGFTLPYFSDEFYSVLFAIIILNIATNPSPLIKLEFRWLDYLGKISYGLYMYHWLAIVLLVYLLRAVFPAVENSSNALLYNIIMYPAAIGLTIALSAASYELVEKRFLNLKQRFAKIKSG